MISKSKRRVKAGTKKKATCASFFKKPALLLLLIAAIFCAACTTPAERHARQVETQTYEASLQQLVQAHVYSMSCPALLPMAVDLLWNGGYGEARYVNDGKDLQTEWKNHDEMRRSRYEVHSFEVGSQRCAVQFLREEEAGGSHFKRRDPRREMELLESIDADMAANLRAEARYRASEAYREALEEAQGEPTTW